MKKIVFILFLLAAICYPLFGEAKVAPYYSMQFAEGAFVPNTGEWNFSINLLNDLGVIVKPADSRHSFVGFYELKYDGPGLRRQEGEKFTDRAMDHIGIIRHTFNITEDYFLKSQLDYMKEYKRTGSNEIWGTGLYDLNRFGGSVSFGRKFSEKLNAEIAGQYHFLNFPNYTDLFKEFQAGGATAESSTGKQNHKLIQAGFDVKYDVNKLGVDIILQNYTKQKVIDNTVQADGSYYSGDPQKDSIINISVSRGQKVFEKMVSINPTLSYKIKNSNQNYLYFESFGSTVPPTYYGNYYSYNEIDFLVPVVFMLGEKWEVSSAPEFDIKTYTKRPPSNSDGVFDINEKQKNNLFILNSGFTFKPNAVTRTTLFFIFQNQKSNTKNKYLPYNYTANYFGIKFDYTY